MKINQKIFLAAKEEDAYQTYRYICELNVFTDTHMGLYLELLGCWGLCQIALAFFFCSFLNSAQTAAMSGYAIALYTCIIGGNMT